MYFKGEILAQYAEVFGRQLITDDKRKDLFGYTPPHQDTGHRRGRQQRVETTEQRG